MHQRVLDSRYRIEPFTESEQVDEQAVIAFWADERVPIAAPEARKRAHEVLFVALHEDDGLVGLCTVYLQRNDQLRMDLWHYRTFIARAHRESDLAFHLLHKSREHLRRRFASGADNRAAGMMIEVENPLLKKYRNEAVWPTSQFTFIGENERGHHCRVYFFPGARVPSR
jgi:hypothetical protein